MTVLRGFPNTLVLPDGADRDNLALFGSVHSDWYGKHEAILVRRKGVMQKIPLFDNVAGKGYGGHKFTIYPPDEETSLGVLEEFEDALAVVEAALEVKA